MTYDNIQKIATDEEDDYTTGCLLDYNYFKNHSQQTFVSTKTSSRRLDQDEYIRLTHTSSEDVFKTSSTCVDQDQYNRLGHTSSRRLQDVFKTSLRRLAKTSSKRLQDIFKTSCKNVFKTPSRLFQDVFKTCSRCFEDVFKTS